MTHLRRLRLGILAATVVTTAVVLAACGSSANTASNASSSGSTSASAAAGGAAANRSKFIACLKAHGVTLPNRPAGAQGRPKGEEGGASGGGGGFFGGGGAGAGAPGAPGAGRFNNPKFRAALQACGGGRFPARRFSPTHAAVTNFVACVKQHGYNLPTPNFSGKGPIFPAAISRDKKFQAASRACASDLRPQGAPSPGGPGSAGGGGSASGSSSD